MPTYKNDQHRWAVAAALLLEANRRLRGYDQREVVQAVADATGIPGFELALALMGVQTVTVEDVLGALYGDLA